MVLLFSVVVMFGCGGFSYGGLVLNMAGWLISSGVGLANFGYSGVWLWWPSFESESSVIVVWVGSDLWVITGRCMAMW